MSADDITAFRTSGVELKSVTVLATKRIGRSHEESAQ